MGIRATETRGRLPYVARRTLSALHRPVRWDVLERCMDACRSEAQAERGFNAR